MKLKYQSKLIIGLSILSALIVNHIIIIKQIKTEKFNQITIAKQASTIRQQEEIIKNLESILNKKLTRFLTITAYTPTKRETDSDPLITASMTKVKLGTVAVSRDLFDDGWVFGRKVYIDTIGILTINDLMNSRYSERIDIFMWKEKNAKEFGKKKLKVSLIQ